MEQKERVQEVTMKAGIWEMWREYERHTGKAVRFYRAFPYAGRGCIEHDQPSHAEVEREFSKSLRFSLLEKIAMLLKGYAVRYAV